VHWYITPGCRQRRLCGDFAMRKWVRLLELWCQFLEQSVESLVSSNQEGSPLSGHSRHTRRSAHPCLPLPDASQPALSTSGNLPLVEVDGILDVAFLVAGDAKRPLGTEGPHEAHARLHHQTSGSRIDGNCLAKHSACVPYRESPVDQRDRYRIRWRCRLAPNTGSGAPTSLGARATDRTFPARFG